jgi:L-aspartate oxidase
MKHYDYIIVGSGIAGLYTALLAKNSGKILILTKGSIEDCNTRHAQGGIAAPIGKNDSPELHFKDTIAAGDGLCDIKAVKILTEEASDRIADLIQFGVPFDTIDGEITLTLEAAHSLPRILHAGGDATGEHIEVTLSRQVRAANIAVQEYCLVTKILVKDNQVYGVESLDCRTAQKEIYECNYIILAAGGAGRLYKYTTNSDVATGDGNALAYEAGAEIIDMEFFQFHPTALRLPGTHPFLISEAVRGEGGKLKDINGREFMHDYSPEAELAPRDVVARGIVSQMKKTDSDHVFLDVTHIPPKTITTRFPNIFRFCLDHGIDITKTLIPVAPAAHYFMGGVNVNTCGETNIKGLFAVGENACTGVHGANRLASNSLLEVLIFGKRIIQKTKGNISDDSLSEKPGDFCTLGKRDEITVAPSLNLTNLQNLMWDSVGIMRTGKALYEAADILYSWQQKLESCSDRPSYELNKMILNARLITEAALFREESRGAHFRTDFPQSKPEWEKHIKFLNNV